MNRWMADISLWQFPASLILGAAFALGLWVLHRYYPASRLCRLLSDGAMAIVLLIVTALALTVEGTWALGLYRTYPFILLILLLMANLGLVTLQRLPQHNMGFLLNHAGLFIILWGATFGAPDVAEARIAARLGAPSHLAYTPQGEIAPLPFAIRLDRFTIDYYDDGTTPRQFRSEISIDGNPLCTEVNSPVRYGGYTIYQDSYDRTHGAYSVLLVVRDPWLWVVWLGTAMLAAGSLILLFHKR